VSAIKIDINRSSVEDWKQLKGIGAPILKKIPINTISAEALLLHPYIKKKQAYLIVNYRTNHGQYNQLEDLEKVKALTPDFIKRIAPYLSFTE